MRCLIIEFLATGTQKAPVIGLEEQRPDIAAVDTKDKLIKDNVFYRQMIDKCIRDMVI